MASNKGGTGKSCVCCHLGISISKVKKVLLIDMDSQESLTHHLSGETKFKSPGNIMDGIEGFPLEKITSHCHGSLDYIAGNVEIYQLLSQDFSKPMNVLLEQAKEKYDFILIDLPPTLSDFNVVLLSVSDGVLLPVDGRGGLSIQGLLAQLNTINLVKQSLNPSLEIIGILANRVAPRLKMCKEVLEYLHKYHKKAAFKTFVRESTKISEAACVGKSIFSYAPNHFCCEDFNKAAEEFLTRTNERRIASGHVG